MVGCGFVAVGGLVHWGNLRRFRFHYLQSPFTNQINMAALTLASFKQVHQNIIWPAVAGNVAWSLLTLVVLPTNSTPDYWARIILLALLTVYLLRSWRQLDVNKDNTWYYILDTSYAITIALLAISTSTLQDYARPWSTGALVAMFIILFLGHATCSWYKYQSKVGSLILALVDALALFGVLWSKDLPDPQTIWVKVAALSVVLLFWWVVMKRYPPSRTPIT